MKGRPTWRLGVNDQAMTNGGGVNDGNDQYAMMTIVLIQTTNNCGKYSLISRRQPMEGVTRQSKLAVGVVRGGQ